MVSMVSIDPFEGKETSKWHFSMSSWSGIIWTRGFVLKLIVGATIDCESTYNVEIIG
jgi:hypothetical protein